MEPLAYSVEAAAVASAASKSVLRAAISAGDLPARKRGRRLVILADDLQAWLRELPPAAHSRQAA